MINEKLIKFSVVAEMNCINDLQRNRLTLWRVFAPLLLASVTSLVYILSQRISYRSVDGFLELIQLTGITNSKPPRRQLLRLAQFNDPSTVQYKQIQPPLNTPSLGDYRGGKNHPTTRVVKPYNMDSVLLTIQSLRYQAFFFVYHSQNDEFVIIHNHEGCDFGCQRVYRVSSILSFALRHNFSERFNGTRDWVIILSTGDVPRLHIQCLRDDNHCNSQEFAPILQFGSVYNGTSILPSAIPMPMPVKPHLPCFESWQQSIHRDHTSGRVCGYLLPEKSINDNRLNVGSNSATVGIQHGLIFAEDTSWDNLIPQIIWRGTDFVFLHTMFQNMRVPDFEMDVKPEIARLTDNSDKAQAAINALRKLGNDVLLPRWKGVLLTSEAELEAQQMTIEQQNNGKSNNLNAILPWVNIKFASCAIQGKKVPASQNSNYIKLQSVGISAIGEYISVQDQAVYKYHIDLGGGGGTTWTGTLEKLAMPGVLFHHVTPTTDYFYNRLQPWVHYIPVRADLTDLKERFDWAESHPLEAQRISNAATAFAKWVGSEQGFRTMYHEYLVDPLKASLEAYNDATDEKRFGRKTSVMDVIEEQMKSKNNNWNVVAICSGLHAYSCKDLDGYDVN